MEEPAFEFRMGQEIFGSLKVKNKLLGLPSFLFSVLVFIPGVKAVGP